MSGLKEMIEKRQREVNESEERYNELLETLKEVKEKTNSLSAEYDEIVRKTTMKTREVEKKKNSLASLQKKHDDLIKKRKELEGYLNCMNDEEEKIEELGDQLKEQAELLNSLEFNISELERRKRKLNSDIGNGNKKYDILKKKLQVSEETVNKLSAEISKGSGSGQNADELEDQALERIQQMDSTLREKVTANEELERRVRVLESRRNDLKSQNDSLNSSIQKIADELAIIEKELLS